MDELTLPYDILRFDYKERLHDRFLATHLHRFEMFTKPVALAVLVEIISPWHPASTLGQKIINSLVREFQRGESQSYLTRFENALKLTNRAVQEALDQTKSPVSCVAILLEPDQIHSSGIGTAKLGLRRNGRLATILGSKSNYNATFAAVTSGDLNPGDWLTLANETFYSTLAKLDDQTWLLDDIGAIGIKLNEQGLSEKEQKSAAILLRLNSLSFPVSQTFLGDEKPSPRLNASLWRWPKIGYGVLSILIVRLAETFSWLWRALVKNLLRQQNHRLETTFALPGRLPKTARRPLLIGILLLIGIIVIWIGYRQFHRDQTTKQVKNTLLTELRGLPPDRMLSDLEQKFTLDAYQSLNDVDRTELVIQLKAQKIFLTDLPAVTVQTPNDIVALETLNNQPIMIDSQGQIWIYNGSSLTKVAQKTLITSPVSLTALSATNIIATDTAGNIWRLDGSKNQPLALTQNSALATGAKLVGQYRGNLYLTNLVSKVTFRVSNFTGDLFGNSTYDKAENLSNTTNPSDLAVNGKVLVADSNGLIVEFAKNAVSKTKFQLPFVNGPVKIAADDSTDLTVIGSGRTLYLIDRANNLNRTIFLASSTKITDIVLDPTNPTKLWLAGGKELYALNLP